MRLSTAPRRARHLLIALLMGLQVLLPMVVQAHGLARILPGGDFAQRFCGIGSSAVQAGLQARLAPELQQLLAAADRDPSSAAVCALCLLVHSADGGLLP
ncbi:MAG: hypothetical protein ABF296_13030, partial [Oceanococcaceae bacterium]